MLKSSLFFFFQSRACSSERPVEGGSGQARFLVLILGVGVAGRLDP